MKEIDLRDLLDTEFTINDKLEMVGTFTLDKINMIADILINLQEENKEWSMIFDTFSKRPYAHKYLEEKKKELGSNFEIIRK